MTIYRPLDFWEPLSSLALHHLSQMSDVSESASAEEASPVLEPHHALPAQIVVFFLKFLWIYCAWKLVDPAKDLTFVACNISLEPCSKLPPSLAPLQQLHHFWPSRGDQGLAAF